MHKLPIRRKKAYLMIIIKCVVFIQNMDKHTMTYRVVVWLFSWEYMSISSFVCEEQERITSIYIFVLCFFRSFVSFDILSEWFMVILYKSNCHLLLWSACTSKRADAEAYVNKSFCQLVFYTRIERERESHHIDCQLPVWGLYVYFVSSFCHRYLINKACCSMSKFSDV
jgi:predicted membrane protein